MEQQKKAKKIEGLVRKNEIKRDFLVSELNRILHFKEIFDENEFEGRLDELINCSSKLDLLSSFYSQLSVTGEEKEKKTEENDNSSDS